MAPSRVALITLACLVASCFATQDESLGETVHDAGRATEAGARRSSDAALEAGDTTLSPAVDAAQPQHEDAGTPLLDLDAGHDAGDGDAGHAPDATRDARAGCREPWEPWECR